MSSSPNVSLGTIGPDAGIPNLNVASIPANIRNGNSQAMQAYSEGLAFEDLLVSEMTQQLASTMYGGSASGTGAAGAGSAGGGTAGGGLLGGASAYASLIPQALTSSIMSAGGLGMAEQFAAQLDPALLGQSAPAAGTSDASGAAGGGTHAAPPAGGVKPTPRTGGARVVGY